MKKFFAAAVMAMILVSLFMPVTALANSAQREFEGVTSTGALVNGVDCPIEVTSEKLTFNIVDYPQIDDENPDYHSNVAAEYTFYNPASYDVNMQLVFPFGKLPYWVRDDYVDTDKYGVYVNGNKIERGIRAIYSDRYDQFDLSKDLPKIVDTRKEFAQFADDTPVYKYSIQSSFQHYYKDAIDTYAQFSTYGLVVVLSDNARYSSRDSEWGYTLKVWGSEQMTIYSIGKQLQDSFFHPSYFAELRKETDDGKLYFTTEDIQGTTQYSYLGEVTFEDLIFSAYNEESGIMRDDYYNAMVDKLQFVKLANRAVDMRTFDLTNQLMLWYQYDVSVPAGQTVTNKVVAPLYPTVDYYYIPTKYHYEYLLSPASSWASFANLDVTINAESYMLESSLEGFTKTDGNAYTAHFDALPQGELTFTLCQSENPKYDNSYSFWGLLLIIIIVVLPICGGWLIIKTAIAVPIVVASNRRNRKQQQLLQADNADINADKAEEIDVK